MNGISCRITAILVLLAGLGGCSTDPSAGYSLQSQYKTGIKSVAVPVWTVGQDVYRRGVEDRLTEALVKRIEMDTPYKVTTPARADTELTGTIKSIEQKVLSYVPATGGSRELELTFRVSFTWKDLRTGEILLDVADLRAAGAYSRTGPLETDFYQGSEKVINELARRIVEHMEADW